jgi:hypothetical protein
MRYLRKFNESRHEKYLKSSTYVNLGQDLFNDLFFDMEKSPGTEELNSSDLLQIEKLFTKYLKPELTGLQLVSRSLYPATGTSGKINQVNWKVEIPNGFRKDMSLAKYQDDYFLIQTELPVDASHLTLKGTKDIYFVKDWWLVDGWDGFEDWLQSSPYKQENNYDLLSAPINDYKNSKNIWAVGRRTNEWRTLMSDYNKIFTGYDYYLFDPKDDYHFGTIYLSGMVSEFKHDGSIDSLGRRKAG